MARGTHFKQDLSTATQASTQLLRPPPQWEGKKSRVNKSKRFHEPTQRQFNKTAKAVTHHLPQAD